MTAESPPSESAFFDTNVLLYLLSADSRKADLAEETIAGGGTISVQVLNELVAVARKKLQLPWERLQEVLDTVSTVCAVVPLTMPIHQRAVALSRRLGFGIYDATIVAAALDAGCSRLYTEDLQHGQRIEGLRVINPFADTKT
jgi:predicted nucleic acid-binding protein